MSFGASEKERIDGHSRISVQALTSGHTDSMEDANYDTIFGERSSDFGHFDTNLTSNPLSVSPELPLFPLLEPFPKQSKSFFNIPIETSRIPDPIRPWEQMKLTQEISNHQQRGITKREKRRGTLKRLWTQPEDQMLRHLAGVRPENWNVIAASFPGRTGKQCRERWLNHLQDGKFLTQYSREFATRRLIEY